MSLHSSRRHQGGVDGFARLPQTQAGSETQQPLAERLALRRGGWGDFRGFGERGG